MKNAIILNLTLQIAGVAGFIIISNISTLYIFKIGWIILFVVGTARIIFKSFSMYQFNKSFSMSLINALSFVAIYQTIGFTHYSGFVKDVTLFSNYHFFLSGIQFLFFFIFYNLCCALLSIKKE